MKTALNFIKELFKHDCYVNAELISASYFRDGDSGVVFSTGKTYRCSKCGKTWDE